jgi:hypothetical protein
MSTTADTIEQKIKRTLLQRFDAPDGNYETVIELTEAGANGLVRRQ